MPQTTSDVPLVCLKKDFAASGINAVNNCAAHAAITGHVDFQEVRIKINVYEPNYDFKAALEIPDTEA